MNDLPKYNDIIALYNSNTEFKAWLDGYAKENNISLTNAVSMDKVKRMFLYHSDDDFHTYMNKTIASTHRTIDCELDMKINIHVYEMYLDRHYNVIKPTTVF